MPAALKVTDSELIDSYSRTQSVWKTAKDVGLCGQSVHERLAKIGVVKHVNVFTDAEREILKSEFLFYRQAGKVSELAARLGRTVQFLSRQARAFGLTSASCPRPYMSVWKYISVEAAEVIWADFKSFRGTLTDFCRVRKYDDDGFRKAMLRFFADEWEHVIEAKAPKTKYRRGRQFEYSVRDKLKELGYFVLRSPASRSPIDLVAIRPGRVLFIQCKIGGALPPDEWNALTELSRSVEALPVLAMRSQMRGVAYMLITGLKDGSKRAQPMRAFEP